MDEKPWKRQQAPHEKMTEDEIKETICDLLVEVHELKESILEQIETMDAYITKLKKHFCPEKFTLVSVPMGFLTEQFANHYGEGMRDLLCTETTRMERK